jgi:hypothetical protein
MSAEGALALASMRKSVALLAGFGMVAAFSALAAATILPGPVGFALATLLVLGCLALGALALGGRLAIERQRLIETAQPDLFQTCNSRRSEDALLRGPAPPAGALHRWLARRVYGHEFVVGDAVRVRPVEEIRATLDSSGALEGLPFMAEMRAFCGRPARVYRVLDKIYDYGRSRAMRPIDRCVLLVGLRCDGAAHAGCEAACYLVWKEAWLEPFEHDEPLALTPVLQESADRPPIPADTKFSCQYTELTAASQPPAQAGLRTWIEPWVLGNVSARAFWVATATRFFNAFQARRGGVGYPWRPGSVGDTKRATEPIGRGDWVRVRSPAEIAATLDTSGKNRGLWFDAEMLKYCGRTFRVLGRVERIVDIKTTTMIPMRTPCIVIEGGHNSGEFLGFVEQHDYMFWREAWLQRIDGDAVASARRAG